MASDLNSVFDQLDGRAKQHSKAEQDKKQRRESLSKVAHETYHDARTLMAAVGLNYLAMKGIHGLDHGQVDSTLRIAAEVPLYAANVCATLTTFMAGWRTLFNVPQTTYEAIRYRVAKRRLQALDVLDAPPAVAPSSSPSLGLG